jgi:hypothetical protein
MTGQYDDDPKGQTISHSGQDFQTAEERHCHIEQDYIRRQPRGLRQSGVAIGGFTGDLEVKDAQQGA